MPNTDNLDQFLQEVKAKLPDEGKIKIIKKEWPDPKTVTRPFLAAHDIVVSDSDVFYLPKESYEFFNADHIFSSDAVKNYIEISSRSINPDQVSKHHWIQKNPLTGETQHIRQANFGNRLFGDTRWISDSVFITKEDFIKVNDPLSEFKWSFGRDTTKTYNIGQHPGLTLFFAMGIAFHGDYTRSDVSIDVITPYYPDKFTRFRTNVESIKSAFKTTMTVFYNDTPTVSNDGETVSSLSEVNAKDTNHDIVPAFEIKVADESFVDKVGLEVFNNKQPRSDQNPKIYTIGKDGVRYSQEDRASGYMRLVRLDGCPQPKGFNAGHVKVSISACDPYAWGNPAGINVPLVNK